MECNPHDAPVLKTAADGLGSWKDTSLIVFSHPALSCFRCGHEIDLQLSEAKGK
jgi:hypothetical protein